MNEAEISQAVDTINEMNTQIASAAEEQTSVTEDINRSLVRIVKIAEDTAQGTLETERASERLGQLANTVHRLVGQFRI
jgi:methyl-accepting chemotaxis protein